MKIMPDPIRRCAEVIHQREDQIRDWQAILNGEHAQNDSFYREIIIRNLQSTSNDLYIYLGIMQDMVSNKQKELSDLTRGICNPPE